MNINIKEMFKPKATDIAYTQTELLRIALIMRIDSYKFSHPFAYPDNIEAAVSYGEARVSPDQVIVPFGIQYLTKKYLNEPITMADVDAAEAFSIAHFGTKLFHREGWEKVVNTYNGKLPIVLRSVPEGTVMRGGQPIYTVACFDKDLHWLAAGFETLIQRSVWYPTTIATLDYMVKQEIKERYVKTGADLNLLPFSLHDFGGRGVAVPEQAEVGGMSHLVNFMGSDTVEGILTANYYYKDPMAGFSVYATEHSIECSFGGSDEDAKAYIRHQLKTAKSLGVQIMSIVIDGYDVERESRLLCTEFKQDIINSGVKVVFRPDSGDMNAIVPMILKMQEEAFGYNIIAEGFKQIKYVGVIQGDGVSRETLLVLLDNIINLGYSADCVVFGSGGALLQKVDRDTLKFAQKGSAILVGNEWIGIAKDPVTDHGKKSKEGVLTLARNKDTGETVTVRLDQEPLPGNLEDIMQLNYYMGQLYNETVLAEVRERVTV